MLLFSGSEIGTSLRNDPRLARCGRCGLYKGCRSPRMPVTGEGRRRVLVVAEAPGKEEDKRNTQLVGPAGQTLRRYLSEIDVNLDRDCWKTNVVICYPGRNPTTEEVLACRSNLLKSVRELEPETIILMGGAAVQSLVGWLWKEDVGNVSRWAGWRIPSQRLNAWICPTFHPSYVMRTEQAKHAEEQVQVISILFRQHLCRVFELSSRPWEKLPEFERRVKVLLSSEDAVKAIDLLLHAQPDVPVSFDFETNMLKPESERAEIVSCAMSNGEETVAFPMTIATREAVAEFLRSPVPKMAHNMKFEDRWCRRVLGTLVKNWRWCSMQAAHVLDNRRGINGLKFQAFVRLGQAPYEERVAPYLEGDSNAPNRIRAVDVRDLLLYNGMDALLVWHVAQKQMEEL